MSRRMPHELEERLLQVLGLDVPQPNDDATDDVWDAWADLVHVQAMLAGWASRIGRRGMAWTDEDEDSRAELRVLTSRLSLVELMGEDVASAARAVADGFSDLLSNSKVRPYRQH